MAHLSIYLYLAISSMGLGLFFCFFAFVFGRGLRIHAGWQSKAECHSSCQYVQPRGVLMSRLQISLHMGLPAATPLRWRLLCESSTFVSISPGVSSLKCFVHGMNIFMQSLQCERMSMRACIRPWGWGRIHKGVWNACTGTIWLMKVS